MTSEKKIVLPKKWDYEMDIAVQDYVRGMGYKANDVGSQCWTASVVYSFLVKKFGEELK